MTEFNKYKLIKDLFDKEFIIDFYDYLVNTSRKNILETYKTSRINFISDYGKDIPPEKNSNEEKPVIYTKSILPFDNIFMQISDNYILPLDFNSYIRDIFQVFNLRSLIYEHYKFSKKKNKKITYRLIIPILEYYFNSELKTYSKHHTSIFNEQNLSERELICQIIFDIFESINLIDRELIKTLKNKTDIVHYVCKYVLKESLDKNPVVEQLLKQKVSRKNNDIDTSNKTVYYFYIQYLSFIKKFKELIDVDNFIHQDKVARTFIIRNLVLDDDYFEECLVSATKDELLCSDKALAYNILEYRYGNLSRVAIRQCCCRGKSENKSTTHRNLLRESDTTLLNNLPQKIETKKNFEEICKNLRKYILRIR